MTCFKTILLAGAVAASGAFTATNADAFFLSGSFSITAYNYNPSPTVPLDATSEASRKSKSEATAANFNALMTNASGFATGISSLTFGYVGELDFRAGGPGWVDPTPGGVTTIADFLGTGNGTLSGLTSFFGGLTNSAGGGSNDGSVITPFTTTTLYKITAISLNFISDLSALTFVRHDDGVTLLGSGTTSVESKGPNTETQTSLAGLTGGANDFTLYYASANGDPSVLEVNAIPLPAAAWLLLGVAGSLVAAKRRSSLRAV